jgi:hypothetical protein
VLGVMLAGIVAMQVEVLKLGASVGRSIERSSALQTRNELLRASVASLSDEGRIERLAAGMGMVMPPPGSVAFLSGSASADRALAGIHAPDPTAFLASTTPNGSVVTSSILASGDGSIIANPPAQGATGTTSTGSLSSSTSTSPSSTSTTTSGTSTSTASSATGTASTRATALTTPAAQQQQQAATQQSGATTGG